MELKDVLKFLGIFGIVVSLFFNFYQYATRPVYEECFDPDNCDEIVQCEECDVCPECKECVGIECPKCDVCDYSECRKLKVDERKKEIIREREETKPDRCNPVACDVKYDYCRVKLMWGGEDTSLSGSRWYTLKSGDLLYKKWAIDCLVIGVNFPS